MELESKVGLMFLRFVRKQPNYVDLIFYALVALAALQLLVMLWLVYFKQLQMAVVINMFGSFSLGVAAGGLKMGGFYIQGANVWRENSPIKFWIAWGILTMLGAALIFLSYFLKAD